MPPLYGGARLGFLLYQYDDVDRGMEHEGTLLLTTWQDHLQRVLSSYQRRTRPHRKETRPLYKHYGQSVIEAQQSYANRRLQPYNLHILQENAALWTASLPPDAAPPTNVARMHLFFDLWPTITLLIETIRISGYATDLLRTTEEFEDTQAKDLFRQTNARIDQDLIRPTGPPQGLTAQAEHPLATALVAAWPWKDFTAEEGHPLADAVVAAWPWKDFLTPDSIGPLQHLLWTSPAGRNLAWADAAHPLAQVHIRPFLGRQSLQLAVMIPEYKHPLIKYIRHCFHERVLTCWKGLYEGLRLDSELLTRGLRRYPSFRVVVHRYFLVLLQRQGPYPVSRKAFAFLRWAAQARRRYDLSSLVDEITGMVRSRRQVRDPVAQTEIPPISGPSAPRQVGHSLPREQIRRIFLSSFKNY